MAKLKARGRQEIFRVEKKVPGNTERGIAEVAEYRALMTDGSILERMVLRYTPEEIAKNYGKRSHDYGWKVRGRAKSGLTLEQLLKIYLDRGWTLAEASSSYFRVSGDSIEAYSSEPFVNPEKAERRREKLKASRSKAAATRAEHARTNDGPGFYVTNNYVGSGLRSRVADHEAPFPTLEEAADFASDRLHKFRELNFQYLLPVAVLESPSRQDAERNVGHVWWINGVEKGPPVDPRQSAFGF